MQKVLKLGERPTRLALPQSSWVAREIERLNPNVKVELVTTGTCDDRMIGVSPQYGRSKNKGSFVKELDDALISGK